MEGLVDPVANLLGGEEAAGGDLSLESLDLGRSELAGIALMVEGTQSFQALGAVGSEPLADLSLGDAEQVGDLVLSLALVDPKNGGEPLGDAFVVGLAAAAFALLADRSFQCQCHGSPRTTRQWTDFRRRRAFGGL